MSGSGPPRTSGDVRFRAAVEGIADIEHAVIRRVPICVLPHITIAGCFRFFTVLVPAAAIGPVAMLAQLVQLSPRKRGGLLDGLLSRDGVRAQPA
jgi:hypothetical protein